ncbi:MAG: ATP-binding protein [Bacteroidota bacterium]
MRGRALLIISFFLLLQFSGRAGEDVRPQEWIEALQAAPHDSIKTRLLLELSQHYRAKEPDKSINYASLALALAENQDNWGDRHRAIIRLLDVYYHLKYDLSKASEVLTAAQAIPPDQLNALQQASIYGYEGKIQLSLNDYARSQEAFFKQMNIYEQLGDREKVALVNFDLGRLKEAQGDYLTAISFYKSALASYRRVGDRYAEVQTLTALGSAYGKLTDYPRNLEYCREALRLGEHLEDAFLLGQVNYYIGYGYARLESPDSALIYFERALCYGESLDNPWLLANTSNELGLLHRGCNTDEVLSYFQLGLTEAIQSGNQLLEKNLYQSLHQYYADLGQHASAYHFLQRLMAANAQLSNEEQSRQLINTQIKYETEKQHQENQLLRARERENAALIQKQRLQNYGLLVGIHLVLILTFLLYQAFRRKKVYNAELELEVKKRTAELHESNAELVATNAQLAKSNGELERFASIASHDLKAPLRNIVSFLGLIKRKLRAPIPTELNDYFRFATDNAQHMQTLIQDILEFSKIDGTDQQQEAVDLNESLLSVVHNLKETMTEKNGSVEIAPLPVIQANKVQVLQLFQNLIGNGLKYNQNKQPSVVIEHKKEARNHLFSIRDNGIGIDPQYHQQVFDMFKRLHHREEYQGTGIGLSICKKIIDQLEGKIWLESQPGRGTTFFFTVPMN